MHNISPNSSHTPVKIWINERVHKVLRVGQDTTCAQLKSLLAELLHIPHAIRPYFAIYLTIDGTDHGAIDESTRIAELQQKHQKDFESGKESHNNGFSYHANDLASVQLSAGVISNPEQAQLVINTHRATLLAGSRGIGHQRSLSNPAVVPTHQHNSSADPHFGKQVHHVHRPPASSKHDERPEKFEPEGENEAITLGVSATPHLEPRFATIPSPSPPRASIKARSKTIAFTEAPTLEALKAASLGDSSFPSPTLPSRLSLISPRTAVLWDSSSSETRLGAPKKPLLSVSPQDAAEKAGSKGRSTSPPPPRQRYTPPPTILSPMIAMLSTASPPASPSGIRHRAQTTGARPSQKWVKVQATKPSTDEDVQELLSSTLDRLKTDNC